jgi:hypothetical protein
MAYKIKRKEREYTDDDILKEWFYGHIPNIVEKTNPAKMSARSLGVDDEIQKKIGKGKIKVSSSHLKVMGVKEDIKNY